MITLTTTTTADKLASLLDDAKTLDRLRQAHGAILRRGLGDHPILAFKLQRSYAALGRLDRSVALFRRTPSPNIFLYTSLIHAHARASLHSNALALYSEMLGAGVEPNAHALSAALKACDAAPGKALHCQAVKLGLDADTYVRTGLVDAYASGGDCDVFAAQYLLDTMPEPSIVSLTSMISGFARQGRLGEARAMFDGLDDRDSVVWNVMIDGYARFGKPDEALALFRRMLSGGARPNEVTVLSVLSACGQIGAEDSGRWVHSFIKSSKIPVNLRVGTALIDMYAKCGSVNDAKLVFDSLHEKDVVAWNSMIVGFALHGMGIEAVRSFNAMRSAGFCPNDVTFIGLLSACANSGFVPEGRSFFAAMKEDYGIDPKIEHYGCVVNLLSRAGHLEEAYELVKSMSIEPDPVLWGTLLGACKLHRRPDLGEEIAELLLKSGLANSGTYVLLSNIYAASGDYAGAAEMRALMRESGIAKEPGCSSIEVGNKLHSFLAGEKSHPRSREIYAMLERMNEWLEGEGYAPQIESVLHDLGESEKRQSLEVHSEKLAIAFGLISTERGATIKVVKNLRVCSDCHVVTKLISKITGRRIVMRDRSRFHHFENGSCSCGDYW